MSKIKDVQGFLKFCEMLIKRPLRLYERVLLSAVYTNPDLVIVPVHNHGRSTKLLYKVMVYENMKNTLSD